MSDQLLKTFLRGIVETDYNCSKNIIPIRGFNQSLQKIQSKKLSGILQPNSF